MLLIDKFFTLFLWFLFFRVAGKKTISHSSVIVLLLVDLDRLKTYTLLVHSIGSVLSLDCFDVERFCGGGGGGGGVDSVIEESRVWLKAVMKIDLCKLR